MEENRGSNFRFRPIQIINTACGDIHVMNLKNFNCFEEIEKLNSNGIFFTTINTLWQKKRYFFSCLRTEIYYLCRITKPELWISKLSLEKYGKLSKVFLLNFWHILMIFQSSAVLFLLLLMILGAISIFL